jgi:hypothetical protein
MQINRKIIAIGFIIIVTGFLTILSAQPSSSQNYVITNSLKQAGVINEGMVPGTPVATQGKSQTIAYFDGLGRPMQTVATQASPNKKDIVSPVEYDAFGREVKKYLPFVDINSAAGVGGYRPTWNTLQPTYYAGQLQGVDQDIAPFSQSVIEPSPLNRILAQGAAGNTWQPNLTNAYDTTRKVIKLKYETGKFADSVRIFNVDNVGNINSPGFYLDGQISIKTSIDEHNGVIKEYSDKAGHTILKRVYIAADSLQTYYIYDDLGQLRGVIQPEGTAAIGTVASWVPTTDFINKWMFLYRFDQRNRAVMKKVPGADSVLMVYDQWDR